MTIKTDYKKIFQRNDQKRNQKMSLMDRIAYAGIAGIALAMIIYGAIYLGERRKGDYSQILPKETYSEDSCLIRTLQK